MRVAHGLRCQHVHSLAVHQPGHLGLRQRQVVAVSVWGGGFAGLETCVLVITFVVRDGQTCRLVITFVVWGMAKRVDW